MQSVKPIGASLIVLLIAACTGGETNTSSSSLAAASSSATAVSSESPVSSSISSLASSTSSLASSDPVLPSSAAISSMTLSSSSVAASSSSEAPVPSGNPVAMATDRWYVLANRANGLVMDIQAVSTEAGAALTQWDRTDGENQQFRFADSGGDYYRLVARHSGLALDVFEFITDDGADIVQWEDLNGDNQQFQMLDLGNGYFHIQSRLSNKVLAPEANSDVAGSRITQYSRSAEQAQQWQLFDIGAYNPAPDTGNGECGSGSPKARVTGTPGNYQMNGQSFGNDYAGAIFAALGELTAGRTQQERVSIMASGDVGDARINLKSHTIFEVCGTMNAAPASRGTVTIWGSETENISIPYLNITGTTSFALLIADTRNLHLGKIDLRLNGGGGIRFDNRGATYNVTIDDVYVEGTGGHGVETWNIDGLTIGKVVARNTRDAGLLLNNTRNATIGLVDGINTGTGTGYATLRFANTNGQLNGGYPTNIYVDKLISRGGGRGLFCVSNSGGVEINSIDLKDNGNNSVLIENCHNVTIKQGKVDGGGEFRISARSEFPNTSNINISNLTVTGTDVRESPCGDNVNWVNLQVINGARNICN